MPEPDCAFEEFKVYYESTELVTDRRIATSRWNYSVCVAIVGGVAFLIKTALERETFLALGLAAAGLISTIAAIFSYLWLRQIDDYKGLNNAKFTVLNMMAPKVRFYPEGTDRRNAAVRSYEPFRREWDEIQKADGLVDVASQSSKHRLRALKASNIERFMPKCFIVMFSATAVLCLVIGVSNWSALSESVRCTVGGIDDIDCTSEEGTP